MAWRFNVLDWLALAIDGQRHPTMGRRCMGITGTETPGELHEAHGPKQGAMPMEWRLPQDPIGNGESAATTLGAHRPEVEWRNGVVVEA